MAYWPIGPLALVMYHMHTAATAGTHSTAPAHQTLIAFPMLQAQAALGRQISTDLAAL